jgi:hypothetical protein
MWVLTPFGFYSVVQKSFEPHGLLTIRARSRGDLENLRDQYLESKMSQIIEDVHADYQFRATVINKDWAEAVGRMTMDIDYDNFKNEVKARQGSERAGIYGRVWSELYEIQQRQRSSRVPQPEQLTGFDVAFAPELAGIEQTDEWRSDEERDEQMQETEQILAPLHGEPVDAQAACDFCGDVTGGESICQSCRQIPEQDRMKL